MFSLGHTLVSGRRRRGAVGCSLLIVVAAVPAGLAAAGSDSEEQSANETRSNPAGESRLMADSIRTSVTKLVVLPGETAGEQSIAGTYGKDTPGLVAGADAGSRAGTISREVGGANINIPIPILTLPGAILGGLSGATKREIQDFRDALTEDLAEAANQPLTNDKLALDVYRSLQRVAGLDSRLFARSAPIPEDTDAVLYVSVKDVAIDIDGNEAILTTSAQLTLRRMSDGKDLYETVVAYRDRDTLTQWTRDENALWDDYKNFARHYLGREMAARAFDREANGGKFRPARSVSVKHQKKDVWNGVTRTTTPTLAWEPVSVDDAPSVFGAAEIEPSDIAYDVEIYDHHRLVYDAKLVPGTEHTVGYPLEACMTYRWAVRPGYPVGSRMQYGNWMRSEAGASTTSGGISGRKASAAPAYTQDFASLTVKCGSR